MSDDAPRSAQGHRPDQRRGRGAPVWWDMLDRHDLPDDRTAIDTLVESPAWARRVDHHARGRMVRGRAALVLSVLGAVLLAVALVFGVWLATSTTERSAGTAAAVLAGIPAALLASALLVALIGRRHHR
jgi:hypothetical protein